jgi:hypothetical protein
MEIRKKFAVSAILLIFCSIIHFYSLNKLRVETGYSIHFFDSFSRFLRSLFGWLPFSFGDILYGLLAAWLIWKAVQFFRFVFKKRAAEKAKKPIYINGFLDVFLFCAAIYLVFNVFWGINYNRKGIAWQINLKMEKYTTEDLKQIDSLLVQKINASKKILVEQKNAYPPNRILFSKVNEAYHEAANIYPFLKYSPMSLKSSMWGWLGNYTGFTGYYNPFTAEAQVNTTVPKFLHPVIACHEVAHQLGYAKEMEANFVGYLAASNSKDPLFNYSVYLDLFVYAYRNLYFTDSAAAKSYKAQLIPAVIDDLHEWSEFNKNHQSIAEPVVRLIYGLYLQGNQQPEGVLSYDEVTGFIIAYYKKFGRI